MNVNKKGIHARNRLNVSLGTLLAMIKLRTNHSKLLRNTTLVGDTQLTSETKRLWLEVEDNKNQAIRLINRLQNC
jgi:hypothetical protein